MWELDCEESWAPKNWCFLKCGFGEDSWESLGLQGDLTSPFWRRWALGFLWRECCWSWNFSTLATSCEELTHWKSVWCWEGLGAGGEGDDRGWDGWMASLTRWTQVWVNTGSWRWTGRSGVLWFMGSQRVGHDTATELNWSELKYKQMSATPTFLLRKNHSAGYLKWCLTILVSLCVLGDSLLLWKQIGFRRQKDLNYNSQYYSLLVE